VHIFSYLNPLSQNLTFIKNLARLFAEFVQCCQIIVKILLQFLCFFIYFCIFYFYFGILKIYQKYTKNSKYTISKFSIPRPLKTNQNCKFWYGNIPSGNPDGKLLLFYKSSQFEKCFQHTSSNA